MSSFAQLKAKRDKRHPAQRIEFTEAPAEASRSSTSKLQEIGQLASSALPNGVEVRTDEKRGRGLYAKKAYKAGKPINIGLSHSDRNKGRTVLSASPLQAVLSIPNLPSACSGCLLTPREIAIKIGRSRSLSPCEECGVLHYCSEVRNTSHWPARY
jgi:hypothetical protein